MYTRVGREWTVETVGECWGESNSPLAGLGWVIGVAMEDLVLTDVVGRRLLWERLMLTLLSCIIAVGYDKVKDVSFTWRQIQAMQGIRARAL